MKAASYLLKKILAAFFLILVLQKVFFSSSWTFENISGTLLRKIAITVSKNRVGPVPSPNPIPARNKISARCTASSRKLDVERRFLTGEKPEHGRRHRLHRDLKGVEYV